MKFLIDAQLPARLARVLSSMGHDSIHTSCMPAGNRSSDAAVTELADSEDRVVVSKDSDFRDGHLLRGEPRRLLVVATGNITNDDLIRLFEAHLDAIIAAFGESAFIELRPTRLIVHADRDKPSDA